MALQDTEAGNAPAQQTSMAEAYSRAHQQTESQAKGTQRMQTTNNAGNGNQAQQPARQGFRFSALGRQLNTNISRTAMSDILIKLEKKFEEFYQQYTAGLQIKLIPLDAQTVPEIRSSLLVVAARLRDSTQKMVAFHTLILAGTGGELPSKYLQAGGSTIEVKQLASDVWEPRLKNFVTGEVARAFGVNTDVVIEMDATTIPVDFRLEDDTLVRLTAANALIACNTELEHCLGFQDINLADALSGEVLTTRVLFNDAPTYDSVGKPVRADVTLKMTAQAIQNGQSSGNDRVTEVASLTGYVDMLLAVDPKQVQQQAGFANNVGFANAWGQQQQQQTLQPYAAQFVITSMETAQLQTPAAQLLALTNALMLQYQNVWANALMPRPPAKGREMMDIRDIGALGYEVPFERDESGLPKRVETKSADFDTAVFSYLLSKWVQPGLSFALDVSDAGPDSWFNGVFSAAAQGRQDAIDEIIRAANVLTNGKFGSRYAKLNGTGQIVSPKPNRVHRGTYNDPDGHQRDLRDYDYIAIANMRGDKNPKDLETWSNSFLSDEPIEVRLADRARLLDSMVQPSYDGWTIRVVFEAVFLQALADSCAEAGLSLRPNVPNSDYGRTTRATAQFAGSMVTGQAAGNLFASNWNQPNNGFQSQATYRGSSRWGV